MILGDDDYLGDNVVNEFYLHLPEFQWQFQTSCLVPQTSNLVP